MNKAIMFVMLFAASLLWAQSNTPQSQESTKDKSGRVRVRGCVSRSSGDFILMQSDPGNSYVLQSARKIKLEHFLGQQVEVSGTETPTLGTSTNFTRRRTGSSVTITVDTISTIAKECTN
jgi:hypothetical protein